MARVLLVDDNLDLVQSLAALVKLLGHEVLCVTDPLQAVLAAREARPDVVVLDVAMPMLDGLQLCRILREEPATRNARIYFHTAYGTSIDRDRTFQAGADGHFVKPITAADLESVLTRLSR